MYWSSNFMTKMFFLTTFWVLRVFPYRTWSPHPRNFLFQRPNILAILVQLLSLVSLTFVLPRFVKVHLGEEIRHIFFIRHGESVWNEAQREGNIKKILSFDHPLNSTGIQQAQHLNAHWRSHVEGKKVDSTEDPKIKEKLELFLSADVIFSSPLTRAAQTCAVALNSHPTLDRKPVLLLSSCREIKGIGGLDTVGSEIGKDIEKRVLTLLSEEGIKTNATFDPYDCSCQWWTSSSDNKKEVRERLTDFLFTLRYTPCSHAMIVVGHSFFFRHFFTEYFSPTMHMKHGILTKCLLKNASLVYLSLDFSNPSSPTKPIVTDLLLMFGGIVVDGSTNVYKEDL
eukprot:TRINITY_DN1240_c0_g1_i6.p1 TRINITY_DN1240_c0_g1~~TRINITY_DN1240_c0_g1_i6.p1  ORF type:complete len:340 (-),score=57.21 TRINITY_DN1240_c0_g1_i6:114-1133(-)